MLICKIFVVRLSSTAGNSSPVSQVGGRILTGVAARERIPGEAGGTVAGGTVLSDLTHCIAGTGVGSNAGVDTGSVLTDLSVPALGVG